MRKLLLYLTVILSWITLLSWKAADYKLVCARIPENLDERAKAGLSTLLGKQSLVDVAVNMPKAVLDSIDHYVKPLNSLQLGGPYTYSQLDSALRPVNLDILNGIKRFGKLFNDNTKPNNERIAALQVLIGLQTAMQLPLQGVTHLLARNEFIKHDIFMTLETPHYGKTALITLRLYDAYKIGVRAAQAKGDQKWIASLMDRGYEAAGRWVAGDIKTAFRPAGLMEIGEGPNWGKIIEPGKDPIYLFSAHPVFPGGYFDKFMNEHLHYPAEEWNKGIEGRCYVTIVVEKDGSITHIKVVGPVSPGIDSEAVRVIKLSPKWQPGQLKMDGTPVRSQWTCIVNFQIKPDQKREDAFNIPFHENIKPAYPGGKAAFEKYINANSTYKGPPFGRVTLRYIVGQTGKIGTIIVERSLSYDADAEAKRLLLQSSPWIPGLIKGTTKAMMGDTISIWFPAKKVN